MFPLALAYVAYGVLRFALLGLLDRPDRVALGAPEAPDPSVPKEEVPR
jgi:hypothetical protein